MRSAEISLTTYALSSVLNDDVFAADGAPLKGIRLSAPAGKIKILGRLHSKGDVPFETEGRLSVTADGNIRVHIEKIKAAHLPVKGLMDLIGETISKLIDTRKVRGVRAEKDDLILIPSELFPPPHLYGKTRRWPFAATKSSSNMVSRKRLRSNYPETTWRIGARSSVLAS